MHIVCEGALSGASIPDDRDCMPPLSSVCSRTAQFYACVEDFEGVFYSELEIRFVELLLHNIGNLQRYILQLQGTGNHLNNPPRSGRARLNQ